MEKKQPSSLAGLFNNNLAYKNQNNKMEFDHENKDMKIIIQRQIRVNQSKQEQMAEINMEIKQSQADILKRLWESHQKLAEIKRETFDQFNKIQSLPTESEKCLGAVMILMNKDRSFWSIQKEVVDQQFAFRVMEFNIEKIKPDVILKAKEHVNIPGFDTKTLQSQNQVAKVLCYWLNVVFEYQPILENIKPLKTKKLFYENELKNGMDMLTKMYEAERKKQADMEKKQQESLFKSQHMDRLERARAVKVKAAKLSVLMNQKKMHDAANSLADIAKQKLFKEDSKKLIDKIAQQQDKIIEKDMLEKQPSLDNLKISDEVPKINVQAKEEQKKPEQKKNEVPKMNGQAKEEQKKPEQKKNDAPKMNGHAKEEEKKPEQKKKQQKKKK